MAIVINGQANDIVVDDVHLDSAELKALSGTESNIQAQIDGVKSSILGTGAGTFYSGPYGLTWDETNDLYVRTGSKNYTAIQSMMRRCVLNADGSVNYYLAADNSNYKADGTPSVLDGSDGNVMVEVPLFYYKYEYKTAGGIVTHGHSISLTAEPGYTPHDAFVKGPVGNTVVVANRYYPAYLGYVSGGKLLSRSGVYPTTGRDGAGNNVPGGELATFRAYAAANGSGWHQIDFLLYEAITLLMIIEYGSMNIQSKLGEGRSGLTGGTWVDGNIVGINGLSNGVGNGSASVAYAGAATDVAADASFMTYRGCENFFGNVWRWADGVNFTGVNAKTVYINQNPATWAADVYTGDYVSIGVVTSAASGYGRTLGNTRKGFIPTSVSGGASNVGTTDYFYTSTTTSTAALVGGCARDALAAGPLYLDANNAGSLSAASVGAGVSR